MSGSVARRPLSARLAHVAAQGWRGVGEALVWLEATPLRARRTLIAGWAATRLALFLGLLLGHSYCDPQFYHYAGAFAAGQWPYRDVPVEYPPLALVLILLPALPLLPFRSIAPRPDPAFPSSPATLTHIPHPNPFYYGVYGVAFACEMLLFDALTLWLIRRAAPRLRDDDPQGLRSGLLYLALVFLNGALLQKFDTVAGTCALLAALLLVEGRPRLGWAALALAVLIKGFPILLLPVFVAYSLWRSERAAPGPLMAALGERARTLLEASAAFVGVGLAATLPALVIGGGGALLHAALYHEGRGTEIESLYANVMLALGWLPGLRPSTTFSGADLSRVVLSPLDGVAGLASPLLLIAAALLVYATLWRATLRLATAHGRRRARGGAPHEGLAPEQALVVGCVAALLAFMLTFRALPAHYLLLALPLAVLIHLPQPRLSWLWVGALLVITVAGQALTVTPVWDALRALWPWPLALLTLRNAAWVVAFAAPLLALWRVGVSTQRASRGVVVGTGVSHVSQTRLAQRRPRPRTRAGRSRP